MVKKGTAEEQHLFHNVQDSEISTTFWKPSGEPQS